MTRPVVLITETLSDEAANWLDERAAVQWVSYDSQEFEEMLPMAEGLVVRTYTQVNEALLSRAEKLKVVGRAGVGLDNIDLDACRAARGGEGVMVVSTPDANTQAVVEYVFGLMLDEYRPRTRLLRDADGATFHTLRKTEVGKQLDELTLGIVGFGRIGKRLGEVAHAVGMNVWACDVLPEAEMRQAVSYPFEYVSHEEIYREADVVTLHVDGRGNNRHMLGEKEMAMLRDDVLLINAARGMLIDHDALAKWAVKSGARVMLDVHEPEPPLPADANPLRDMANVVLLPHLASRTDRALANMSWVVRDVWSVLSGEPPRHPAW